MATDTLVHDIVFIDNSLGMYPGVEIDYEAADKQLKDEVNAMGYKVHSVDSMETKRVIGKNTTLCFSLTVEKKVDKSV